MPKNIVFVLVRRKRIWLQATSSGSRFSEAQGRMFVNGNIIRGSRISSGRFIVIFFKKARQIHRMETTYGKKFHIYIQYLYLICKIQIKFQERKKEERKKKEDKRKERNYFIIHY